MKFYNHLKDSDPDTLHYKALTHRESAGRSPLSQLVLSLCSQTQPSHTNQIRPNQIIQKQREHYLAHWKEATKNQSKLECYLALNREYTTAGYLTTVTDPKLRKSLTMYRLSEHSLAVERGRHRQTWLPKEERLCTHCTLQEVETELHFLTRCQLYQDIRDTFYPQISSTQKDFRNMDNNKRLPYLLGEIQTCDITAATFISCCDRRRASNGQLPP